ncbi:MAG: prepilin-type N-terminal cleavage/methylation domain-containing protein [Firmicutes bacterium]|nr:prepilin-type N-terminal cleavage/methylation domain-containing protein [Bacillota bacterium]
MMLRRHLSGQKGFTLIELLVVVAILGVLATIAVPRVMDAIDNARARKAEADLTIIRDALERWYLDYGIFPPSLTWLADPAYQYVDPNFTFKNSYGKVYFYAVLYNGSQDPTSFTDYVLGDPGKLPEQDGTYTAEKVCEGLKDANGDIATARAYAWYTVNQAPSDTDLDNLATPVSWTGVVSGQTFTLDGDGSTDPDMVFLATTPNTKPVSQAIIYSGK